MNVSPCWKIKAGAEAPKHLDLQRQTHDHRMYFIWLTLIQTRPFKTTKKWEGSDFLTLILPVENLFFKMHKFNIIVTPWGSRYWVASLKKTAQVRSKLFEKPQPYHGTLIRGEGKVGWAYYRHLSCNARRDTLHQWLRHQLFQTHLVELYAHMVTFHNCSLLIWTSGLLSHIKLQYQPHAAAQSHGPRLSWLSGRLSFFLSFLYITWGFLPKVRRAPRSPMAALFDLTLAQTRGAF